MEIILLQDIVNLGYKDDIVNVKNGYARNFLFPNKMAIVANPSNKKSMEEKKKQQKAKYDQMISDLTAVAKKIEAAGIKIGAKTGTSGKIFGSVTTIQLAEAIKVVTGAEIDRKRIKILNDIKALGTFKASIELHRDVVSEIEFEVVADE